MKYGLSFFALSVLVVSSCSIGSRRPSDATFNDDSLTIFLGMKREVAEGIIRKCGGQDITANLAVVGPEGEWPLSGLFWDLGGYDSVLEISAEDGKVNGIGYWTAADFAKSKEHRAASRKSLKSVTLNGPNQTVKVEVY